MSLLLMPSRRVIIELIETYLPAQLMTGRLPTVVQRGLVELAVLHDALTAALAEIDRMEAVIVASVGYPRVKLPGLADTTPTHAANITTIRERFGTSPTARRLTAALRRHQRRFVDAGAAAGLPVARSREHNLAARIDATTSALLLAPVADLTDIACKLIVLVAMSEPGPRDGNAFPTSCLRTLLADIARIVDTSQHFS